MKPFAFSFGPFSKVKPKKCDHDYLLHMHHGTKIWMCVVCGDKMMCKE